jgi:hypothetical protein
MRGAEERSGEPLRQSTGALTCLAALIDWLWLRLVLQLEGLTREDAPSPDARLSFSQTALPRRITPGLRPRRCADVSLFILAREAM